MALRMKCEGIGKPFQLIDTETGKSLEGIVAINMTADPQNGVVVRAVLSPNEIDVEGQSSGVFVQDPETGKPRKVASIIWAPDEKGQQAVWKAPTP